jgi:hypothetical protein
MRPLRHMLAGASFVCAALICTDAAAQGQLPDVVLVPGSTAPRVQLTGEHFQIQVGGTYFSAATPSATLTRGGVVGTDLGQSLVVGNRIFLFFGDTVGAYKNGDRFFASRGYPPSVGDSIGYIPNIDFSACRYIADVADQLARGIATPSADASVCPSLSFLLNPLRNSDEHVFKPFVISGLASDESQATFRVPTAVFTYNDRAYVFATTKLQDARPANAFWLQSVLAKSDQSPTLWTDTTPPTFTKLYTSSSHATIDDPANPPPIENGPGKFMGVPTVVMNAGTIADLGLARLLPRELQGTDVAFFFGRGWHTTRSDMYLAAVAMRDLEGGTSNWFYYAGNRWTNSESDAAGLLQVDDVAHHSVAWNGALGRFVLMRNSAGRIVAQFSTTPWGPWSNPITLLGATDDWILRLAHRPGLDRIVQSLVPVYQRDGSKMEFPDDERGVPYSPGIIDSSTVNADGSVTIYYTLSMWNPYQTFLVSSTFRKAPSR